MEEKENMSGNENVVKGERTSQIPLLSEHVDSLFDLLGGGKGRKPGKLGRFPMKANPQKDRNEGISFLG